MTKFTPVFRAKVSAGKLEFEKPGDFLTHLESLDGDVDVTVDKRKRKRSDKQNKYYRGVIVKMIADQMGEARHESVHNMLRGFFLKDYIARFPTTKSTTELSTVEMEEYHAKCRMWASQELGLYIPDPNSVDGY